MSKHKNAAAVELGRKGGQASTEAKKRASMANGAKGGRPRERCKFCRKKVPFNRVGVCAKCMPIYRKLGQLERLLAPAAVATGRLK